MKPVNASIITIGDELLIGQTIDTNSAFIGQELNRMGIWVKRRVAVGDVSEDIVHALDEEGAQSDVIIMTGGLGPTADDITKPLLCKYFGGQMIVNQQVLDHVKYLFEKIYRRPGPIMERNLKQAEVPDTCTVLHNARGSAPGMWFEKQIVGNAGTKKIFISLPGVPHEMKGLVESEVIPRLQRHFIQLPNIQHRTLLTAGVGESTIAEKISSWEAQLPPFIRLAYLPHFGMVRLRLTARNAHGVMNAELDTHFEALKLHVKEWMVIDEDLTLQQALARLLVEKGQTVGTAESCTGGYIAHLLSRDPGSSRHYKGSIVSYANEVKTAVLSVSSQTLASAGAVSEQTVREMVSGGLAQLGSDYIIAVSGILGPDGGTEQKPVGTVWIAVGNRQKTEARVYHFRFDRARNIEQTAIAALEQLRKFILTNS